MRRSWFLLKTPIYSTVLCCETNRRILSMPHLKRLTVCVMPWSQTRYSAPQITGNLKCNHSVQIVFNEIRWEIIFLSSIACNVVLYSKQFVWLRLTQTTTETLQFCAYSFYLWKINKSEWRNVNYKQIESNERRMTSTVLNDHIVDLNICTQEPLTFP